MRAREITLTLTVIVQATTGESEVEQAINAALDVTAEKAINAALDETPETGLFWGEWRVGAVAVASARPVEVEPGYFGPFDAEDGED